MASPSTTCADVLAEHSRLRARLEQLVREALPTARKVGHSAVRRLLEELRSEVVAHLEIEERALVPLLQTADAWGPVRVAALRERHAVILRALESFAEDLAAGGHRPCDLLERLESVVEPLLRDLADEEAAIRASKEASGPIVNHVSG